MKTILVGHGYFGRIYREHLDKHPDYEVVGVCDIDYRRLDILKGQTVAASYDAIKDNVEHDAVIICTTPNDHADLSIKALAAGKHVLCMKPGAMSMTEFSSVQDTAREADKAYMIDYTLMNSPEYDALLENKYGTLISASASRHVAGGPKDEGIILDLLSHDIALFESMFWTLRSFDVSCTMLNQVTAALTITSKEGERLFYAVASYNATYPKKELLVRSKPDEELTNPLITQTWNQNQRFVSIETQGRSIQLHYKHEPDLITRTLNNFAFDCTGAIMHWPEYESVWRIIHAAMHSAEHDGMLVEVAFS